MTRGSERTPRSYSASVGVLCLLAGLVSQRAAFARARETLRSPTVLSPGSGLSVMSAAHPATEGFFDLFSRQVAVSWSTFRTTFAARRSASAAR